MEGRNVEQINQHLDYLLSIVILSTQLLIEMMLPYIVVLAFSEEEMARYLNTSVTVASRLRHGRHNE